MRLTPKLISECTLNSNFSADHGDNNENHSDNKNEGNYPANKYMSNNRKTIIEKLNKVNNRKNVLVSLWLSLTPCFIVFNVNFKHFIFH